MRACTCDHAGVRVRMCAFRCDHAAVAGLKSARGRPGAAVHAKHAKHPGNSSCASCAHVHVTISLRLRGPRTAVTALHCLLLLFHATILCSTRRSFAPNADGRALAGRPRGTWPICCAFGTWPIGCAFGPCCGCRVANCPRTAVCCSALHAARFSRRAHRRARFSRGATFRKEGSAKYGVRSRPIERRREHVVF